MSYKVSSVFIEESRSRHGTRTVGCVIAEVAWEDGVGWLRQGPSKSKKQRRSTKPDKKNLEFRTKLSERQIRRCIDWLQDADELEAVWAQDGENRFQIYRIIIGELRELEVDYERGLPFLEARFWTPDELLLPFPERSLKGHALTANQLAAIAVDALVKDRLALLEALAATPDLTGHFVRWPTDGSERTSAPERPDILDTGERTPVSAPKNKDRSKEQRPLGPSSSRPPQLQALTHSAGSGNEDRETAAASESEPVSLERAIASLAELKGWDSGSIRQVEPLLQRVPRELFEGTLAKTHRRVATSTRPDTNPVGLFIHLLRGAIDDWRQAQQTAALDAWDAQFGEAGIERVKADDPERYLRAWAAPPDGVRKPLPENLVCAHVIDYVFDRVGDDVDERHRLLRVFNTAYNRGVAEGAMRDWTLVALDREGRPLDAVEDALTTLTEGNPAAREQLLAFAREIQANIDAERAEAAA